MENTAFTTKITENTDFTAEITEITEEAETRNQKVVTWFSNCGFRSRCLCASGVKREFFTLEALRR
jgi:hypothetical protein